MSPVSQGSPIVFKYLDFIYLNSRSTRMKVTYTKWETKTVKMFQDMQYMYSKSDF